MLLFAAAAGCSSTSDAEAEPGGTPASNRRALAASVVADGTSTVVTAQVLDERGLPTPLRPGEHLAAHVASDDYVLVLTTDDFGDAIYRATLPAMLSYADVQLDFGANPIASVRVSAPFTIQSVDTDLHLGDELRVEFKWTPTSPSGRALITFEGDCLPKMVPAALQTYGGISEARFDTTNLSVTGGGCDATATIMFVDESYITGAFDSSLSPRAKGIQQRAFRVHLAP